MAAIYVSHNGSDTSPYDTEAKATASLASAISVASDRDIIWIKADDTYTISSEIGLESGVAKSLTFKGYYQNIGDQDYGGAYYQDLQHGRVNFSGTEGLVAFRIRTMIGDYEFHNLSVTGPRLISRDIDEDILGGSLPIQGTVSLYNCYLSTGSFYTAFQSITGVILQNTIIVSEGLYPLMITYDNAGGGEWNGFATIDRCRFIISSPTAYGTVYLSAAGMSAGRFYWQVSNCTIDDSAVSSSCERGISMGKGAATIDVCGKVFNNVIYGGSGKKITTGIYGYISILEVYNNIIYGAKAVTDLISSAKNHIRNNCVYLYDTYNPGISDIDADPQFTDPANGDFTPQN